MMNADAFWRFVGQSACRTWPRCLRATVAPL